MTVTLLITQKAINSIYISGLQHASKSLAAASAMADAAAKHMLFCLPGLYRQDY